MKPLSQVSLNYETAFKDFLKAVGVAPHTGVFIGDIDGYCLHTNRAFRQLLYNDVSVDPKGLNIRDLEPAPVAEERIRIIREVCTSGKPVALKHTRLGRRVESFLHPWNPDDHDGEAEHIICLSQIADPELPDSTDCDVVESSFSSWGPLDRLTKRQLEVLALLREGYSHKEVGAALQVSPKTVETHRDQLVRRLGVPSTLAAIRLADRAGLDRETARKKRYTDCPWQAL